MIPTWFRMPCLFQMMTGLYCPGCGGTRAVRALLSGHPVLSFLYHPVVPYMASVAVWAAASWILYFATGNRRFRPELDDRIAYAAAATNSWMSGYLGGNFKPDEGVTMRDAIKAVLGVLGYTNEDFSGSLQESRLAKFKSLSLDSGIYRDLDEVLTREDCINLFYNLMKAKTKEGNQYGSKVFDLTYNSDGEINTSSILDNSLKGPKILDNDSRNLKSLVPFSLKDATMFLNGEMSDESEINDYATVIYYHEETKMIFAYSNGGENKGATEGRIKAIYYDSSDPFTPVKVVLNTDYQDNGGEGDEFQISGSELQYLFSVYGEFEVGDKIAIVWEKSGSDENATYTVVDVVGDY